MKSIAIAALLPLLMSCGVDRAATRAQDAGAAVAEAAVLSPETFALGSTVTSFGAVPADATGETFLRGGEIYLSVDVGGASTTQNVEVRWIAPDGDLLRFDTRKAQQGTRYVAFSSGETRRWTPGSHRAVVVIDGRVVTEKQFALM